MTAYAEKRSSALVFFLFFGFFLLTLARNFSAPHDAIDYLNNFKTGGELFNPHHLLYHITAYGILSFVKMLFPGVQPFLVVETLDAIWGSLILVVVYQFYRNRFGYGRLVSFLATCLPAFSFGMWFYSINIEVYMPPLFFLLLSLYLISRKELQARHVYAIIFFHVMAILFHQANILFTPVVLWRLWKARKELPLMRLLPLYAVAGGGAVLGAYLLIGRFVLHHRTMDEIVYWMRGYTNTSTYWFPLSFSTLMNAVVGLTHAFIGAHFLFRVKFVEDYLNSRFFYHNLSDELFLVQKVSATQAMMLLILSGIFACLMLGSLIMIIARRKTVFAKNRDVLVPLLLFLAIYSVFFYFWMPENLEFWIPQMTVLWLVLAGSLNVVNTRISKKWLFGIMAALLLVINYYGSIKWLRSFDYDLFYAKMLPVKQAGTPKDLTLLEDGWIIKSYLEYYTSPTVRLVPQKDSAAQRTEVDGLVQSTFERNGKIFIYRDRTVMHSTNNPQYVDSLLRLGLRLDSLSGPAGRILVIGRDE